MSIHKEPHPLAGKTVTIADRVEQIGGSLFVVEDYWDRVSGISWMNANGNPAAMQYGIRTGMSKDPVPTDNEVLYGKIGGFGCLVHYSEITAPNG